MENRWVTETEEVPIYGDRWWNKNKVVEYDCKYNKELKEVAVFTRLFCGYATHDEKSIPEHASIKGSSGPIGGPIEQYHYSYHENADGARALAEMMVKEYHASVRREQAWEIALEAKRKAKDELFGDYPPKTLGKA
jgi:hypothetical protein